jgi:ribosome-associated toxin RatA of RatAB toxin-antitoxin module
MKRLWILIIALLVPLTALQAADISQPHPHQGVLKPYPKPPPTANLTAKDLLDLAAGKPVYKQTEGETGGRGLAIFHVKAPPAVVWSAITDFDRYPQWIDAVETCEVYGRNGNAIFVRFVLKSFGISVEYFIEHDYRAAETWGTWTLDYSRESDLSDSVGSWLVREVSPGVSQVEYSVDLKVSGWVPGFVRNILVDSGLEDATQWLKKEAEARASK